MRRGKRLVIPPSTRPADPPPSVPKLLAPPVGPVTGPYCSICGGVLALIDGAKTAAFWCPACSGPRGVVWNNVEGIDFGVHPATAADGTVWLWLTCSICGAVDATTSPRDLGCLSASAQGHLERRHADLIHKAAQ